MEDSRKRKRYAQAVIYLAKYGYYDKMGRISFFTKVELIDGVNKGSTDCRGIQGRTPEFNVLFGCYIKTFEKKILSAIGLGPHCGLNTVGRVFAKGLNNVQRGRLIQKKMQRFKKCLVFSVDASRFDQHVSILLLQFTHALYAAAYPNDKFLLKLLRHQLKNAGVTRDKTSYVAEGGRASGDMDTGLGNSLITFVIILLFALVYEIDIDTLNDGDDGLIFMENDKRSCFVDNFSEFSRNFGFDMKLENETTVIDKITFCQSNPLQVMPGKYVMVRNPKRAIGRALQSNTSMSTITEALQTMWAIGSCELALHVGVPVLQSFALFCLRNGLKCSDKKLNLVRYKTSHAYWQLPCKQRPLPVSAYARASFETCFGVGVRDQVLLEEAFDNCDYTVNKVVSLDEPYDFGSGQIIVNDFLLHV